MEGLTDPEPVTLHIQSPIRLWIMETIFHKLVRAIKALSRQDGRHLWSSGIFHLQKQVASTVFSPLLDAMMLGELNSSPSPLATRETSWH